MNDQFGQERVTAFLMYLKEYEDKELIDGELANRYREKALDKLEKALDKLLQTDKLTSTSQVKGDLNMALEEVDKPSIFICYAHQDNESDKPEKRWLDRLLEHLEPLNLQDKAEIWSDQRIEIGDDWHESIQTTLEQVKAAVLLVSPSFLKSKYIKNHEIPILLKRAKDRGVVILPIIVRECLFNETKFKYPHPIDGPHEMSLSVLQAANSLNSPLNGMQEHEQDRILVSVAKRLLTIVAG